MSNKNSDACFSIPHSYVIVLMMRGKHKAVLPEMLWDLISVIWEIKWAEPCSHMMHFPRLWAWVIFVA